MARAPAPTREWTQEQVILFFKARFPQHDIRPERKLRDLGVHVPQELADLAGGLNSWPAFAARGLRLTPAALSTAATVAHVVREVSRGLSAVPAGKPAKRRAGKPVKKRAAPTKKRTKPAKKRTKPAKKRAAPVKSRTKKAVRKLVGKPAPKRRIRFLPVGDALPGDPFGPAFELPKGVSSPRGPTRPSKKKAAAKRTVRARRALVRERVTPKRKVRARPPVRRMRGAPAREPRYANAALYDPSGERELAKEKSLQPGQIVRLRLDIGELSSDSQVVNPKPIDEMLPAEDLDLDVMVSSTDFVVATDEAALGATQGPSPEHGAVAHGYFFLPGNGDPARTRDNTKFLNFFLRAPEATKPGIAHARIGYYYKNVLVQSQKLTAHIGEGDGFEISIDYTLSSDWTGLDALPSTPRISIFTNANGDGVHQIVLRHPGPPDGQDKGRTITIGGGVDVTIEKLRKALSGRAPQEKLRAQRDLINDLTELAPIGWSLYTQLAGKLPSWTFQDLKKNPQNFVVQVARPTQSDFVLPWAFLYDIPMNSGVTPTVCPTLNNWNGTADLFTGSPRQCPSGRHEKDVLCPFGFWGARYSVEQISRTEQPTLEIPVGANAVFVAGEAQYGIDQKILAAHIKRLRATVAKAFPQVSFSEAKNRDTLQKLLGQDLPFVYLFCHGETVNVADRNTWLAFGDTDKERMTAADFIGWTVNWSDEDKRIWDKIRPLVFLNACHSLEIAASTLVSYLDAFAGNASAAGIIGTEVKVEQNLASELAEQFFASWLTGATVESALREVRMDFLRKGNLFGLVYTPYCWSELKVVKQ